jgi:hypothetical protein
MSIQYSSLQTDIMNSFYFNLESMISVNTFPVFTTKTVKYKVLHI